MFISSGLPDFVQPKSPQWHHRKRTSEEVHSNTLSPILVRPILFWFSLYANLMCKNFDMENSFMIVLQHHLTWTKSLLWCKQVKLFQPIQQEWRLRKINSTFTKSACHTGTADSLSAGHLELKPSLIFHFKLINFWCISSHWIFLGFCQSIDRTPPLQSLHLYRRSHSGLFGWNYNY